MAAREKPGVNPAFFFPFPVICLSFRSGLPATGTRRHRSMTCADPDTEAGKILLQLRRPSACEHWPFIGPSTSGTKAKVLPPILPRAVLMDSQISATGQSFYLIVRGEYLQVIFRHQRRAALIGGGNSCHWPSLGNHDGTMIYRRRMLHRRCYRNRSRTARPIVDPKPEFIRRERRR